MSPFLLFIFYPLKIIYSFKTKCAEGKLKGVYFEAYILIKFPAK